MSWSTTLFRDRPLTPFVPVSDNEIELRRLAEFGRVSATLIHELSTPLTAASITLEQLRQERSVSLVRRAQRDLKQLERYLNAARQQLKGQSEPTSFSLTVAIHQVVMILSARARSLDVKLLINTVGSVRLYGDKVKFQQIIANLINNAIDSYEGGSNRPRLVKVQVEAHKTFAVVSVSDYGKGISRMELGRVFNPFYSTKAGAVKSLGIGLATVKRYIEQDFNGSIKVKSRTNYGSSFDLRLPLVERSTKGKSKTAVLKRDSKVN